VGQLLARNSPADEWLTRAPVLNAIVNTGGGASSDGGGGGPGGGLGTAAAEAEAEAEAAVRRALSLVPVGNPKLAAAAAAQNHAGLPPLQPLPLTRKTLLAASRVALALGPQGPAADTAAQRCLRAAVTAPFATSPPLFGRPAAAAATNPTTTSATPTTSVLLGLPPAPTAAAVSRLGTMAAVRAEYPARLNLAGGWTDTPPYSLERKGAVLHVAILTESSVGAAGDDSGADVGGGGAGGGANGSANGGGGGGQSRLHRPISATAVRLPGRPGVVRLISEAGPGVSGRTEELRSTEALLQHSDPTHPFALLRACVALVLVGLGRRCSPHHGHAL